MVVKGIVSIFDRSNIIRESATTNWMEMEPTRYELTITSTDPGTACNALAAYTGLSKSRIKQAMNKGAVWHQNRKTKLRRLRKATATVKPGDLLVLYYNPAILAAKPSEAHCQRDMQHYSIWYKPAGLMTQGTRYGDHCALSRQVERHFRPKRRVLLVHRIDREASGLVIMAHSRTAAARISALLRQNRILKRYAVWVLGDLYRHGADGRIDMDLDGKSAITLYRVVRYDRELNQTLAHVRIQTGRLHQIRRHFGQIGFPIMGDPRYGRGNHCPDGLRLVAFSIAMDCPFGNGRIETTMDMERFEG